MRDRYIDRQLDGETGTIYRLVDMQLDIETGTRDSCIDTRQAA